MEIWLGTKALSPDEVISWKPVSCQRIVAQMNALLGTKALFPDEVISWKPVSCQRIVARMNAFLFYHKF